MWLALETILQLNPDDIEDAITDGGQDGGIDAIHIAGRTVNILSFKYTEKFTNCSKNFPKDDLDALVLTVQAIFQKSLLKRPSNFPTRLATNALITNCWRYSILRSIWIYLQKQRTAKI
jgi:hypothetical protein